MAAEHMHSNHFSRRAALQAGSIGLMGLGMADVAALRGVASVSPSAPKKSVLFVFLTGGLSHHDSFDMKPEAPETVRGEFRPIDTNTPGIQICEHLPLLAARSQHWSLVRSVSTNSNSHGVACHALLTGRLDLPPAFGEDGPTSNDWPSMLAMTTYATTGRGTLPPAVVLPQPSVNEANKVRPGQYAGRLGNKWDAWHVNIAAQCALGNGACPNCFRFDEDTFEHGSPTIFEPPALTVPEGGTRRLQQRVSLLDHIEEQRRDLEQIAEIRRHDRFRQNAITVLADPKTKSAFDVENADPKAVERYGRNKFGLSCLMAYRLIDAGVSLVQVNLGKNSSWDTHRRNFLNLKKNLFPYTDQAISALLDDLSESGLLDSTLVIVTGEFGRTPIINKDAGRDHWGPCNTMFFAGGGVQGGNVIGASDKIGAYPVSDLQTPENLAATVFHTLGIPHDSLWHDVDGRPHEIYRASPISGLM